MVLNGGKGDSYRRQACADSGHHKWLLMLQHEEGISILLRNAENHLQIHTTLTSGAHSTNSMLLCFFPLSLFLQGCKNFEPIIESWNIHVCVCVCVLRIPRR